jgi:hypothetical protein
MHGEKRRSLLKLDNGKSTGSFGSMWPDPSSSAFSRACRRLSAREARSKKETIVVTKLQRQQLLVRGKRYPKSSGRA